MSTNFKLIQADNIFEILRSDYVEIGVNYIGVNKLLFD